MLPGEADVVDGVADAARVVLDRAAGQPRLGGEAHGLRDTGRVVGEAVLGVGRNWHVDGGGQRLAVGEHLVAGDVAVEPPQGRREPAAGRGDGREPERGEQAGGAGVPGVGLQERVAGSLGLAPTTLGECFIDVDGEPLLERLRGLALTAAKLDAPISFQ